MENNVKKKNNSGVIIAILCILLLASIGFICYDKFLKKDASTDIQDSKENELEVYPYSAVYINAHNCIYSTYDENVNKPMFTIKTKTKNAKMLSIGGNQDYFGEHEPTYLCNYPNPEYVIYYDDGNIYYYDVSSKTSKLLDLPAEYDITHMMDSNWDFVNYGIIYNNGENTTFYYDIKEDKIKFDNYDSLSDVTDGTSRVVSTGYLTAKKGNVYNLIEISTGKIIVSRECSDHDIDFTLIFDYEREDNIFVSAKVAQYNFDEIRYDMNGKVIK